MQAPLTEQKYSYADYLSWPDDERWELIEGVPYSMSPAPSDEHQRISWELSGQIRNFLVDKSREGRAAPFDVRIPEGIKVSDEIIDVVQPDIVVICDAAKIDKRGCQGAPEFIIEILSPSTASKDSITKVRLYEKNGVGEYWIIDSINKLITIRILDEDGKYGVPRIHEGKGRIRVETLPDLTLNFDDVFSA